jgi:hypothetical protein
MGGAIGGVAVFPHWQAPSVLVLGLVATLLLSPFGLRVYPALVPYELTSSIKNNNLRYKI